MTTTLWLLIGLALLAFFGYRAAGVWLDTGQRKLDPARRVGWALVGALFPDRYWWAARIEAMTIREREELLAQGTSDLGLSRADSLTCPLCSTEVPRAWALDAGHYPTIAPGPIECPECDFRLDACRHCAHFLPGSPQGGSGARWIAEDLGSGRCNQYRVSQPVEQTTTADMARRLKERGFEQVRAPMPILDSFLPPDSCRAFTPERRRLKRGGLSWPDARRIALLRLLALPAAPATRNTDPLAGGEDPWLL
jgi:hypothetical protein